MGPRCILAGLSGGSGKTIVSLGLARALVQRGFSVAPFKKGPDYIDAAWLSLAAGAPVANLDPHLMDPDTIRGLFHHRIQQHGAPAPLALIEGNRGLFDGLDIEGSASTAQLARILAAPVIVVMDCTKMTRTAAAIVHGLKHFEEGLDLAGVILNRTAGPRHRDILTNSIEALAGVPVLGALPKLPDNPITERHMGLNSILEIDGRDGVLDGLATVVAEHVDLEAVMELASAATAKPLSPGRLVWPQPVCPQPPCARIGVVRDAALWFYYQENLEALERAGALLVQLSLLDEAPWPELDGLYLGGGFPETQAARLAANEGRRTRLRRAVLDGLPVYAECGGFMYLGERLVTPDGDYPMAGVLPVTTVLNPKPRGLGYVEAVAAKDCLYYRKGERVVGHEFHYSHCEPAPEDPILELTRGTGMGKAAGLGRDGLSRGSVYASYTHVHALAQPLWAPRFVAAAAAYAQGRGRAL